MLNLRRLGSCALAFMLLLLVTSTLHARIFELTPNGSMSIQQAADEAQAGDTIRLASGVYKQHVAFRKNSGTFGNPITLEGPKDAIIDGQKESNLVWEDVSFLLDGGKGLYRAKLNWRPWHITSAGKELTQLYYKRVKVNGKSKKQNQWPAIFEKGPQGRTLKGPNALAMVNDDEQMLYVRFMDNANPADKEIVLAEKYPVVMIEGTHRIVIRGITIRNSWCAVYLKDTLGSVVEDCKIGPAHHGIWLGENADRCTVRFNDVSLYPYGTIDPLGQGRPNWTNWLATKTYGYWDHFGICFTESTGGNQVHDNYVHDHWGGIEENCRIADCNDSNNIHHNLIRNIADDGLEPEGTQPNSQWHDNIVINAICGFRIKPVLKGPLYIYRNIIYDCGEGFRNFSTSPTKPYVYVYHNTTFIRQGAYSSNSVRDDGLKNYYYYNNLMFGKKIWGNAKGSQEPNWHADHNVFVRQGDDSSWQSSKAIIDKLEMDKHSQYIAENILVVKDKSKNDLSLTAKSPARGAAANLKTTLGKTLPGLDDKIYQAAKIDAGALAYGQEMPKLPRSRDQILDLPQAGYWPAADAKWRKVIGPGQAHNSTGRALNTSREIQKYWDGPAKRQPIIAGSMTEKVESSPVKTTSDSAIPQKGNMLKNPLFASIDANHVPTGWKLLNSKTNHTVVVDSEDKPQGVGQAVKIHIDGQGRGQGIYFQRLYTKPGSQYMFSAYLKGDIPGIAFVQIKIYNGKKELKRINTQRNTKDWQKVSLEIDGANVNKIEVIARFKQSGYVQGKNIYFADMYLGKVSK